MTSIDDVCSTSLVDLGDFLPQSRLDDVLLEHQSLSSSLHGWSLSLSLVLLVPIPLSIDLERTSETSARESSVETPPRSFDGTIREDRRLLFVSLRSRSLLRRRYVQSDLSPLPLCPSDLGFFRLLVLILLTTFSLYTIGLTIIFGLSMSNYPIYIFVLSSLCWILFHDCAEFDDLQLK